MLLEINISEINNGFIIKFFDSNGPPELDINVYSESFEAVLKKIVEWKKKLEKKA